MFRWTVHLTGGPKRSGNAAVAVGDKVYSFGSFRHRDTSSYMNDMDQIEVHIFNTVSLRWLSLPPVTTGRGELSPEVPSVRESHTAVLIGDVIYIWGGINTHTWEYSNVLYAFAGEGHSWSKPEVSGTPPEARVGHSACVLGKVMYVFGGWTPLTGCTNDIYELDTATMVWALINTIGTPAPVSHHSATIIGTQMFVFGGIWDQSQNHYNNVSVFDTETDCWLCVPSAQLLPEARKDHSAFAYNGELYIFAGDNLNRLLNDMWKFNPETFLWRRVEFKVYWMTRTCCCMVGDRIVVFGGNTHADMYILDLNPSLKTLCKLAVNQHCLEQSGLPHDIRWELSAMTTDSNGTNNIAALDSPKR